MVGRGEEKVGSWEQSSTPRNVLKFMVQKSRLSRTECVLAREASDVHCQLDELVYVEMNELLVLCTERVEHP